MARMTMTAHLRMVSRVLFSFMVVLRGMLRMDGLSGPAHAYGGVGR
jgi:hypothetical protein